MIKQGSCFNSLQLISPEGVSPGSHIKAEWLCSCGRSTTAIVKNVVNGNTSSCGRCNELSAENMASRKFGKLRMANPTSVLSGSGKKVVWDCECGRIISAAIRYVISGNTSSCGRCLEFSIDELSIRKFGKLRCAFRHAVTSGSNKPVEWLCDCGRSCLRSPKRIFSSFSPSCGLCNEVAAEEMSTRLFGKLKMKIPKTVLLGPNKLCEWVCHCGNEITAKILTVTSGNTKSCGKCYSVARSWWEKNREGIRSLRCPIESGDLPEGMLVNEGLIKTARTKFITLCPACGKGHETTISDLKQGKRLTCGCSYDNISASNVDMAAHISSAGLSVSMEEKVNGLKYDIFIPERRLLIEINGLKWHSVDGSKERDIKKYRNALMSGYDFLMFFEDEWRSGKAKTVYRIIFFRRVFARCALLNVSLRLSTAGMLTHSMESTTT